MPSPFSSSVTVTPARQPATGGLVWLRVGKFIAELHVGPIHCAVEQVDQPVVQYRCDDGIATVLHQRPTNGKPDGAVVGQQGIIGQGSSIGDGDFIVIDDRIVIGQASRYFQQTIVGNGSIVGSNRGRLNGKISGIVDWSVIGESAIDHEDGSGHIGDGTGALIIQSTPERRLKAVVIGQGTVIIEEIGRPHIGGIDDLSKIIERSGAFEENTSVGKSGTCCHVGLARQGRVESTVIGKLVIVVRKKPSLSILPPPELKN